MKVYHVLEYSSSDHFVGRYSSEYRFIGYCLKRLVTGG